MKTSKTVEAGQTMKGPELLEAIANAHAVYVGVRFGIGDEVTYMKWREKSEALRKRVRKIVNDQMKGDKDTVFHASIIDAGGEKIVIMGDHQTA